MASKRMDNVGIVVDDLAVTIEFFRELGYEISTSLLDILIRATIRPK